MNTNEFKFKTVKKNIFIRLIEKIRFEIQIIILPRTAEYKQYYQDMEDMEECPERWFMDGEREFTEKAKLYGKIYEELYQRNKGC